MSVRARSSTWGKNAYVQDNASAEAGASVEPVIVLELVDLDALAIVGRWRYQCHSTGGALPTLRPGQKTLRSDAAGGATRRAGQTGSRRRGARGARGAWAP
jgi:hypothetical protein